MANTASDEILLYTAVNEEDLAQEILVDLVSDGLILSGSFFPVKTVFMWEGQIHIDEEYKLIMKTREGYYEDIEKYLMKNHPYRAPEIIRVAASFGSAEFKKHITAHKQL
jgi:periplasmic divalent cation tolerance protein